MFSLKDEREIKSTNLNDIQEDSLIFKHSKDSLIILAKSCRNSSELVYLMDKYENIKWNLAKDGTCELKNFSEKKFIGFGITHEKSYLLLHFEDSTFILDLNDNAKLLKEISDLSLCDVKKIKSLRFFPIELKNGKNHLLYLVNEKELGLLLFKKDFSLESVSFHDGDEISDSIEKIELFKSLLVIILKKGNEQTLLVYDLEKLIKTTTENRNQLPKTNDNEKSIIYRRKFTQKNTLSLFMISNNLKYLILYEYYENLLIVVDLDTGKENAQLPLSCDLEIMSITSDSKYLVLALKDKRVITYLILDPAKDIEHNKMLIRELPSRYIHTFYYPFESLAIFYY